MVDIRDEPILFTVDQPIKLLSGIPLERRIYSGLRRVVQPETPKPDAEPIERFLITDGVHGILQDIDVTAEVRAGRIQVV